MAYNLTLADNITGLSTALGFINVNANGYFFMLLLLAAIFIISIITIRNGIKEFRAVFFALVITLIPTVLLAAYNEFGVAFIPPWYLLLHFTFMAITGVFAYFNK